MKTLRLLLILLLPVVVLVGHPVVAASQGASKDEAKAMAVSAADLVQKEGPDKAFAAFNAGGKWRDRDLYVFVFDKTGTWRASGARPELIGTNDLNTPDSGGKLFVKDIVAINKGGWVDYKFKSPQDGQIHDKSSYFVRVGDFLVGVGAYKY